MWPSTGYSTCSKSLHWDSHLFIGFSMLSQVILHNHTSYIHIIHIWNFTTYKNFLLASRLITLCWQFLSVLTFKKYLKFNL
jgi:hypothetical protein